MERKIFIVIPVYNNIEYTLRCLATLEKQEYANYQTIVVNDGSSDNTTEKVNAEYPNVVVLEGDGNLWWTGATNMGIEHALKQATESDFVLALNNDLEVKEDYLTELVQAYDQNKPCLIGSISVHLNNPEHVAFLGEKWNPYTAKGRPTISENRYNKVVQKYTYLPSDALPGRGMLIPVEVFNKIGLFDFDRFPQYLADYDFSRRAIYAGYKLQVATKAIVMSVVENTGVSYIMNPTWKTFLTSLKSIKSPNRLVTRYHYGMIHSPLRFGYVIIKTLRVTVSFLRAWVLKNTKFAVQH
ncbi:glycosyltransferase family 2 protein [Tunicatimonas pelagia]|uniref:glycosyltransferase family 2 protein n=1 Tax=Tunicatimonas pelagia TaxID=931531 RepID=UPI0026656E7A|nr:glycosyltransferase family 2 protein [Tunicatimonas pelagia]WKN40862.1 glycosyltransferase family 2 protein [Tunicatimonas pelagia]